jgi:hypothetical protein
MSKNNYFISNDRLFNQSIYFYCSKHIYPSSFLLLDQSLCLNGKTKNKQMKLGIMQAYFFPYIGYYQHIHHVDKFLLYDRVSYIKKKWVNRNLILEKNKIPVYVTIPIKNHKSGQILRDVMINEESKWRDTISRAVYFNYKKAPYFKEIYPIIESVIGIDETKLSKYCNKSIIDICVYLDIETEIKESSIEYDQLEAELFRKPPDDSYFCLHRPIHNYSKKTARVLKICELERADVYVNTMGGMDIYQQHDFKENNIDLMFIRSNEIIYSQQRQDFFPNLSIVDVLMHCGKEKTKMLLEKYTLIR